MPRAATPKAPETTPETTLGPTSVEGAQAVITVLKNALMFYAQRQNYSDRKGVALHFYTSTPIADDEGAIARQALTST